MPAISDDGAKVAYVVASSSLSATSSRIHVIGSEGVAYSLFPGIDPQWFSDSAFYYIAPDGIRLYDTVTQASSLAVPIVGQGNFKLALSPNRTLLTFSNPDARHVYFYRISQNGLLLTPIGTLDILVFRL